MVEDAFIGSNNDICQSGRRSTVKVYQLTACHITYSLLTYSKPVKKTKLNPNFLFKDRFSFGTKCRGMNNR